jgi:hypothetical protein
MFQISKIGTMTREKYIHYYNNIESKWTPIELIIMIEKLVNVNHLS